MLASSAWEFPRGFAIVVQVQVLHALSMGFNCNSRARELMPRVAPNLAYLFWCIMLIRMQGLMVSGMDAWKNNETIL